MTITPIGTVESSRLDPIDDGWDTISSAIVLNEKMFSSQALNGLEQFSHIEVLFWMHRAGEGVQSRRPRGNPQWPETGIFAQRAKDRPNRIGTTICRLVRVEALKIFVQGLDAIHGTPVLDIKPWVREFGPRGEVRQPRWMTELMEQYW